MIRDPAGLIQCWGSSNRKLYSFVPFSIVSRGYLSILALRQQHNRLSRSLSWVHSDCNLQETYCSECQWQPRIFLSVFTNRKLPTIDHIPPHQVPPDCFHGLGTFCFWIIFLVRYACKSKLTKTTRKSHWLTLTVSSRLLPPIKSLWIVK